MPDPGVEVLTWPDERLYGFDLVKVADGDMFLCEMWDGAVDDVKGRIPSEWRAALLDALLEAEGKQAIPANFERVHVFTQGGMWPALYPTDESDEHGFPIYFPKEPTDG